MDQSAFIDPDLIRGQQQIHWILRISAASCFIGHGAFGIITKAAWIPYFQVAHIPESIAWKLMPLIGLMDISLGIITIISPRRAALIYMTIWAVWTALLRPLAAVPQEAMWWEFFERAGNYGVPFAFLLLSGFPNNFKELFVKIKAPALSPSTMNQLITVLRWTTGFLLIGHGGFGAFKQKPMLIEHWHVLGLLGAHVDPVIFITLIGVFEILLGLWVIIRPWRPVLYFILVWKMATELLYPLSGTPVWEFVERFGSYGGPLVLAVLLSVPSNKKKNRH